MRWWRREILRECLNCWLPSRTHGHDCWRHRVDGGVCAGRLNAKKLVSLWGIRSCASLSGTKNRSALVQLLPSRSARCGPHCRGVSTVGAVRWMDWIDCQPEPRDTGRQPGEWFTAADSSPVLLAYDAEVETISARGRRRFPYSAFHTGYKRNVLAPDELLFALHLPRRFAGHQQYLRKVGRGGQWLSRRSL